MARHRTMPATAGALLLALAACATAAPLSIDMGEAGQRVEVGFVEFSGTVGGTQSSTFATDLAVGGNLTVELALNNDDDWRRRTNTEHPIGNVVEDLVFTRTSATMTLSTLEAGAYYARTYHHDPDYSQGDLDLALTDTAHTNTLMADNLVQSTGTRPGVVTTVPMVVRANGSSDVVFTLSSGVVVLNGLEIIDVASASKG